VTIDVSTAPLLATKLFPPRPRVDLVHRERLIELLRTGVSAPLTVVRAPAGWGKSTLVAEWVHRDRVPVGWVSLDAGDDDPHRFWAYLLTAVDRALPGAAAPALRRLSGAGSQILRDVVPVLVNELAMSGRDLVLVLDDYHLVTDPEVHRGMATMLEHPPPSLHVVLLTRAHPPLPLARWRARDRLVELDVGQLRFTEREALELLNGRARLGLSAQHIGSLLDRTEGWAAGLHLAALRLAGRQDPGEFIDRFTGEDRHVEEYLVSEVLEEQSSAVRDFLVHTSVLERLNASLCTAVTGRSDAADLLEYAYRQNLFVTPLDDAGQWFRYHHLFRALLRAELQRTAPDRITHLHHRAAQWYAAEWSVQSGAADEAVHHALEAHDLSLAAALVARAWRAEFNAGRWQTVVRWVAALPRDRVVADPALTAAQVWMAMDTGRLDVAHEWLDAGQQRRPGDPELRVLRALEAVKSGSLQSGLELLLRQPAPDSDFVFTVHRLVGGICGVWMADLELGRRWLGEALERARSDGNQLAVIYALGYLGLADLLAGRADDAARLAEQAADVVRASLSEEHFVAMMPALVTALVRLEEGDARAALDPAAAAVSLARRGAGRVELAAALLVRARALREAAGTGPTEQPPAEAAVLEHATLLAESRALLRAGGEPCPVVQTWLAAEPRGWAHRPPPLRAIDGDSVNAPAPTADAGAAPESLTEREVAILKLLSGPLSQRELAGALYVSHNTVKTHLRAIYRKLGAASREEAVIRARQAGLL